MPENVPQRSDDSTKYFIGESEVDQDKLFRTVIDLGTSFKTSDRVFAGLNSVPDQISFSQMPEEGVSYDDLVQEFSELTSKSSNWGCPGFLGFPDSGNNIPAIAAAVLIPFLNQNLANQDICYPQATFIEMEVVHWLRKILGYSTPSCYEKEDEIGGILTLGGCLSNTIALIAAREKLFPNSGLEGLPILPQRIRVLVPEIIEHYSIRSSMSWLGLGESNVIRVPVNDQYRMNQCELKRIIAYERGIGNKIIACVAYAGDSRSMRIDDLESLAEILRSEDVWFHADACHGSQLAFSEKHKDSLRGIEKADSITIDPHKVLCIPYTCSFVLFKDPATLRNTATSSDLILNTQWSLGQITPFIGSKSFDALKLWATIKSLGRQGIGKMIDDRLSLTRAIQNEIQRRPDLMLLNKTDINSCMLIFIPQQLQQYCLNNATKISDIDLEKLNALNRHIKQVVHQDGKYYVHGFSLKSCSHQLIIENRPVYVLRLMNGNPLSTPEHAGGLLDMLEQQGKQWIINHHIRFIDRTRSSNQLILAQEKLNDRIYSLFEGQEYVAVLYGSSADDDASLLSDMDLMVFAPDSIAFGVLRDGLENVFRSVMAEEDIAIDSEVPFERKLLVSIPFAENAIAEAGIYINENGYIPSICKTPEYLMSDEMLQRLVLNVLTTPIKIISGRPQILDKLLHWAGVTLVELVGRANPGKITSTYSSKSAAEFVEFAMSDGDRSGESYLGYKDRFAVVSKLTSIYLHVCHYHNASV